VSFGTFKTGKRCAVVAMIQSQEEKHIGNEENKEEKKT
jgi:hypothetical protein